MTNLIHEAADELKDLFEKTTQWAEDRNLIKGATPQAQFTKLIEEWAEFAEGWETSDADELKDGLGDTTVVLTVLAAQLGTNPIECMQAHGSVNFHFNHFEDESIISAIFRQIVIMFGRLATGISKKDQEKIKSSLGAALVGVAALTEQFGLTMQIALAHSYNEIKDRKGRMVDGVFVKEADLIKMGLSV